MHAKGWTSVSEGCDPYVAKAITPEEFRTRNFDSWLSNHALWTEFEDHNPARDQIYAHLIERVLATTPGNGAVGDFACGSGVFARRLGARAPELRVYGFDRTDYDTASDSKAAVTFEAMDVETGTFPEPFLDAACCILSAFEFPSLEGFFRRVASGLKPNGKVFLVVLDPIVEANRILLDKLPSGNCTLHKLGNRLVLESYFTHAGRRSLAPYFRILYSLLDYSEAAETAGLTPLSARRIPGASAAEMTDPEFVLLEFDC